MKILSKFYLALVLLVATALMLAACGDAATSTPAPVATTTKATTAAATTSAPTTAPATTAAPTIAPATTAPATTVAPTTAKATTVAATTAAATTAATSGSNTVSGLGVTMTFPAGWNTTVQDKDNEGVLSGTNPDGSYISIYRFTQGDAVKGDLMTRANNLLDNLKTSYPDLKVLEKPTQVSSDTARLGIEFTDKKTSKVNTEIVLVIDDETLKGTYLVEAGAEKAKFNKAKDVLVSILNTIKTNPAAVKTQPAATAASGAGNVVKALGINLTFPAEWQTQINDKAGEGSILSVSPEGSYINIFRFTTGALVKGSLTDRASAVVDYLKSLYPDLTVIEQPNAISSDTARFSAQFTDPTKKNSNVEVVLVIDDESLKATYVVEAGADKTKFDGQLSILLGILNTLKTS